LRDHSEPAIKVQAIQAQGAGVKTQSIFKTEKNLPRDGQAPAEFDIIKTVSKAREALGKKKSLAILPAS
jgi:hypothetical protein